MRRISTRRLYIPNFEDYHSHMNQNEMKHAAAEAAIAYVEDGSVVGVGTGSTADFFIAALGKILNPFIAMPNFICEGAA